MESSENGGDKLGQDMISLKLEISYLNKALVTSKNARLQLMDERDFLKQELLNANIRISKLENYINAMNVHVQDFINTLGTLSSNATDILKVTDSARNLIDNGRPAVNSSPVSNSKTQAVKPMIGGHVIFRPTINLRRVNEIPVDEFRALAYGNISLQNNFENPSNDTPEEIQINANDAQIFRFREPQFTQRQENIVNQENEPTNSSEELPSTSSINRDLYTIAEVDENTLPSTPSNKNISSLANALTSSFTSPVNSPQVSLLSGVFRDVRVYLSPMDSCRNVTTGRPKYESSKTINDCCTSSMSNVTSRTKSKKGCSKTEVINHLENDLCCKKNKYQLSNYDSGRSSENSDDDDDDDNGDDTNHRCNNFSCRNSSVEKSCSVTEMAESKTPLQNNILKHASTNTNIDPLEGPSSAVFSFNDKHAENTRSLSWSTPQCSSSPVGNSIESDDSSNSNNKTPKNNKKFMYITKRKTATASRSKSDKKSFKLKKKVKKDLEPLPTKDSKSWPTMERPQRRVQRVCLKEPLLNTKMRRPK